MELAGMELEPGKPLPTDRTRESSLYWLSWSQYRMWCECESKAHAKYVTGEYKVEQTEAMAIGSYVHQTLLGQDVTQSPLLYTKKGDPRACLRSADALLADAQRHPGVQAAVSGEAEVLVYGQIGGHPWRAWVDCWHGDATIVEIKTAKDFAEKWVYSEAARHRVTVPWYEERNYPGQTMIYRELVEQATGCVADINLIGITKQRPAAVSLLEFAAGEVGVEIRAKQEREAAAWMSARIDSLKSGDEQPTACGTCDWCRSQQWVTEPTRVALGPRPA
ncbi:MAG: hypothetical protein GY851_29070 [bacterium]|nr:hypothetical protein [bacterium]